MFSCEFCKISNNTIFTEHIWATTASYFNKETVNQDYFCFYLKIVQAQVFSCEFCEIFEEHLFYRTPLVAASDD